MYFWNLPALSAELKASPLSASGSLCYLIAHSLAIAVTSLLTMVLAPQGLNGWDYASAAVTAVIFVAGSVFAFRANGGAAGRDFLGRFLSLAWVLGLRVYVPVVLVMALFALVLARTGPVPDETTWLETLVWAAIEVLFYWRLSHHMGRIAKASETG